MRRLTIALALLMFTATTGFAQMTFSDVGASLFFGTGKLTKQGETVTLDASFAGLTWYPRYIFSETGSGSLSIGIPLSLGASGSVNSRTGGNFSFGLDIPVAVDYNFGFGAFPDEESDAGFGGFLGAGFGYTTTASSTTDDYTTGYWDETDFSKSKSYGPMLHAGVRFPIMGGSNAITIRLSYKKGLEEAKYNFFGGTLLYRF